MVQEADRRRVSPARAVAFGIVLASAVAAPYVAIRSGRVDSAALFVGVPLLLAVAVLLAPPAKSLHGLTFRLTTFGLLVTSAFLHEGAACVVLAAPLVYGVAHLVVGLVQLGSRSGHGYQRSALLVLPLLAAASMEGIVPSARIAPEQTVVAERVVPMTPAELEQRLGRGPRFDAVSRPRLLRISGYPTPTAAHGRGLAVGDRWSFTVGGDPIITEVVERRPGRIVFGTVADSSKTRRWVRWRESVLTWLPDGAGTVVRIESTFERRLDPSWYFGPIDAALIDAGIEHFADALVAPLGPPRSSRR
jgi:hypothetical protein